MRTSRTENLPTMSHPNDPREPDESKEPDGFLRAAGAARRLGVSVKALRLYEAHGLLRPARSQAGYRLYGPDDLRRARDIVGLRALGLGLAQVGRAIAGDADALDAALARREAELGTEFHGLRTSVERLRALRERLARGHVLPDGELQRALGAETAAATVTFDLPWPWAGERFELMDIGQLMYLVGPLGSGKTRLAHRLAQRLPEAMLLGPERFEGDALDRAWSGLVDEERQAVQSHRGWLVEEGATDSVALRLLLIAFEASGGRRSLVIDMIEDGLDRATQETLMPWLRRRVRARAAPVVAMTRSSSILDLSRVGPGETILLCPANHAMPRLVAPHAAAPGYETLCSCLATPEARARLVRAPA